MDKKKVFIIGAGYGGIRLAKKISKFNKVDLTVIDNNSYHYLQTDVYDYIASKMSSDHLNSAVFSKKTATYKP